MCVWLPVVLAAALALGLIASASASAASFAVDTPIDAGLGGTNDCTGAAGHICSLREAIVAANTAGGANTITVPAGHYTLTQGELGVSSTLTITGTGSSSTIVDAGGSATTVTSRVFNIGTTGSLTMSGVTVENGHPADDTSGGGILASGPLSLTNVVVTANTVSDPTSTAFSAETVGGGIMQGCAVYDSCGNLTAPIMLTNVTLSNNQVRTPVSNYAAGGGLFESTGSPVTITNSTITGNTAPIGGGIVEAGGSASGTGGGGTVTITGSTLSGNGATGNPCGICLGNGTGGAIEGAGVNPPGGTTLGTVILNSDTITGNTATKGGGAIADEEGDSYTITGTTIASNTAGTSGTTIHGGGILGNSLTGTWAITNSTLAGNTAFGPGQQISLFANHPAKSTAQLTLNFTTLDGTGGGTGSEFENSSALAGDAGAATVKDTIINGGPGTDCSGSLTSAGYNLVSDSSCGFSATGDQVNATVGLNPLANNGGPTQTEALSPSSPAIDRGGTSCLTSDQRGVARPDQAGTQCDVGAFEFQGNPSPLPPSNTPPPSNMAPPAISGTPTIGQMLSCSTGSWTNAPLSFSYQWNLDGTAIANATSNAYTVQTADQGHTLTCSAQAHNAGGASAPATSAGVSVKTSLPSAPSNTAAPAISGNPTPGDVLTCSAGGWTNAPTRLTYSWQQDGKAIGGQTTNTYVVQFTDEAHTLSCAVIASNAAGNSNPAASAGAFVGDKSALRCPKPSGSLSGTNLGPLALLMTRAKARRTLRIFQIGAFRFDDFCLYGGWGIRVAYPTKSLLKKIPAHQRKHVTGRIVLALTANPFYNINGVHPGAHVAKIAKRLKHAATFTIGQNVWYRIPGKRATGVLKVRHGVVYEIGIADKPLSGGSRQQQRSFIAALE